MKLPSRIVVSLCLAIWAAACATPAPPPASAAGSAPAASRTPAPETAAFAVAMAPPAGHYHLLYDPASRRVFAFNGRGRNATAIDAAAGTVAGTVPLDGKPEFAVADGTGRVFVNIEDKNQRSARTMALNEKTHQVYLAAAEFGAPPAPTPEQPRPRAPMVPNSFTILVLGP